MIEDIIKTTARFRRVDLYDDEIQSLARELRDHRKWHGRSLTVEESVRLVDEYITKHGRATPLEGLE